MADNSKKLSELPLASNAAGTDRVLILRDPAGAPSTRTITVANLIASVPYANSSVAGTIKVGQNLTVNATGYLNSQAGGGTGTITFTNNVISTSNVTDNIYINNPNNGIQIGGSWLVQMSATSNAVNIWGDGNTTSYTWCYQEPNHYAEAASYVQSGSDWAQVYVTSNTERSFYITAHDSSASPAIQTELVYTAAGILHLPDEVGDIYRDGVSVLGTRQANQPEPSITYVGEPIGLPSVWTYTSSPPKLQYTSNNSFMNFGTDYYWLNNYWDNNRADYSGISEIHFNNIGGLTDYFLYYKKYEDGLTTIDLGAISYVNGWFNIGNFSNTLVSISANNLTETVGNFEINQMHTDNGAQFVFPALQKTNSFYIDWNWNYMANTVAPSFPALRTVNSVYIYYNKYVSWADFPSLETSNWEISIHHNTNDEAVNYACPGFPSLVSLPGYIEIYANQYMNSVPAFTSLVTVGNSIDIFQNSDLTSYPSFPALENVYNLTGYENPNMTGFDGTFIPSIKQIRGAVNFSSCALSEAAVDAVLARIVTLDGTNGTTTFTGPIYLNGGSNSVPSAQGMADIATLEGRGCYVSYNS